MAAGVAWLRRCALTVAAVSSGCGGGGSDGPGIVNAPTVVSVTVTPGSVDPLDIGQTIQLTAVVQVQNGASQAVTWSSSAPTIASVNGNGLVTAVANGQATITATSIQNSARSGSVTITVSPPGIIGVTLNSGSRTLGVGQSFTLVATVDATGNLARTVTFLSSAPNIATVTSTDNLNATVTGVTASATPATITARSTVDASKTASIQVTVAGNVRITSVTPSPLNVARGSTAKLTATVQADAGVSPAVTFTSQNTAIATVSADGTVTGVALGQTSVVVAAVADPNIRVTVPVNVTGGVTSVTLTPDRDTLRLRETRDLTLSVVTEPGVSPAVTLSSRNNAVFTIDANARVTAIARGQAFARAISVVDPTVGDSTLIVVMDPCTDRRPLAIGPTFSGAITAFSCNGRQEFYTYTVTQPSALVARLIHNFPVSFIFFSDQTGGYVTNNFVPSGDFEEVLLVAPGTYGASVLAQSASQVGTYSIFVAGIGGAAGACVARASTGITANLQLNLCGVTPQGRPTGTYRSYSFGLLPFLQAGQTVTITVTANGFVPLVQSQVTSLSPNPPTQSIAPGTNQVSHTITSPAGGGFAQFFVSSRDAGASGTFTVTISGPPIVNFNIGSAGQAADRAPVFTVPRR